MAQLPFRPYQPKREINVGYGIQSPPPYTPAVAAAFRDHCPTLGDSPYLLFLSRIHEKKGVDMLVNAYAEISRDWSASSEPLPKLVIAGPGMDTPYGSMIQQKVNESAFLKEHILFPGMLNGAAKWGAFYGCEAFVLPSHQENFGIAVAEAMACNKPVLISDQINIWREIESGNAGLVAPNTPAGTKQVLQQWLQLSFDEKQEMGAKAKATFEFYFAAAPAAERFKDAVSLHIKGQLHNTSIL